MPGGTVTPEPKRVVRLEDWQPGDGGMQIEGSSKVGLWVLTGLAGLVGLVILSIAATQWASGTLSGSY